MRYKNFILAELFTTYTPIKIAKNTPNEFVTTFECDDTDYKFIASNDQGEWMIRFDATNEDGVKFKPAKRITNPTVVFSTVLKSMEIWLKNREAEVDTFAFTTNNDTLKRIYEKLMDRFIAAAEKFDYEYRGLFKNIQNEYVFTFSKEKE